MTFKLVLLEIGEGKTELSETYQVFAIDCRHETPLLTWTWRSLRCAFSQSSLCWLVAKPRRTEKAAGKRPLSHMRPMKEGFFLRSTFAFPIIIGWSNAKSHFLWYTIKPLEFLDKKVHKLRSHKNCHQYSIMHFHK